MSNGDAAANGNLEEDGNGNGPSSILLIEQPALLSADKIRERERKWRKMMDNWSTWMTTRSDKVHERCIKGIPGSCRGRAWQLLTGAEQRRLEEKQKGIEFSKLVAQTGAQRWLTAIENDVTRQFPEHEMFAQRGGYGQTDLFDLLKAYTILFPVEGYCQAQAPVACILLMHMPVEHAFWCFVQICERPTLLSGYYSQGLEKVQVDAAVMMALLRKHLPSTHKHFVDQGVDPLFFVVEWFMCIFVRTFPFATVCRILDQFLYDGPKIMFRVAFTLIRSVLGTSSQLRACRTMYDTIQRLKKLPADVLGEAFFLRELRRTKFSEKELESEHRVALEAYRKANHIDTKL